MDAIALQNDTHPALAKFSGDRIARQFLPIKDLS